MMHAVFASGTCLKLDRRRATSRFSNRTSPGTRGPKTAVVQISRAGHSPIDFRIDVFTLSIKPMAGIDAYKPHLGKLRSDGRGKCVFTGHDGGLDEGLRFLGAAQVQRKD